jgi:hypothetical protein
MLKNNRIKFRVMLFSLLLTSCPSHASGLLPSTDWRITSAVKTSTGHIIPAGAYGIIIIKSPREITLLQLRGIAGTGVAYLRSAQTNKCQTLRVRFIAGDFEGRNISAHKAPPIQMILRNKRIIENIQRGEDIVSDMFRTSSLNNDPSADIIVEDGFERNYGFIVNVGSSLFADIFGPEITSIKCSEISPIRTNINYYYSDFPYKVRVSNL